MLNMKKIVSLILGAAMLLSFGAAAAESALPEIPEFRGDLNVRPINSEEEAIAYAKEIWALDYLGMDFPIEYYWAGTNDEDSWGVYAKDGPDDGDYCFGDVIFDREGNVLRVENASSGVFEVIIEAESKGEDENTEAQVPEDDEARAEWRGMLDRKLEYPFLKEVCPKIYEEYTKRYPIREGNNELLTHYYATYIDSYNNTLVFDLNYSEAYQDRRIAFAVQTSPVIRIVYFDVNTDAEEGGNG